MKKVNFPTIFLIFFLLLPINMLAQNAKIDSLENELSIHVLKDSIRVKILNNLADLHYRKDFDKTINYLNESEAIAKSIGYKKGEARTLHIKGIAYSLKTKYTLGDQYLKDALELYEQMNYKKGTSIVYNSLGVFYYKKRDFKEAINYYSQYSKANEEIGNSKRVIIGLLFVGRSHTEIGNYKEAIVFYKKALKLSKETNNKKRVSHSLTSIGNVYSHQGNYPLALEYHNEALDIAKESEDFNAICASLMSVGNVYIRLGNYDKGIEHHKKALKIANKYDKKNEGSIYNNLGEAYMSKKSFIEARNFFEKALIEFEEYNNRPDIAICLYNIGGIYLELKDYKTAHDYFEKAKSICLEVDNQRGLCSSYLGLSKVYLNQNQYDLALTNALKSKDIASKLELLDFQRDVEEVLYNIHHETNDHKQALINHKQFKKLNDSIFNKENIEKITQLEYEYKYKQQLDSLSINELKLTKKVLTTSQDLEKSQRNLFLGVIGFLMTAIVLGAIIFFLKLRHEKTKTQNIAIEQKLLRSQMTPHFIFNSLSVLQGMILNKEDKKSVFYLSKFSKLLRITLENSRDKIVPLNQELEAVNNYLELQNLEDNTSYDYTILVDKAIDETLFKIPPMLIQPFIENAIEHAFKNQKENRKIDVQLKYLNNNLICTITDNGIGIDAPNGHKRKDKKSLATTITSERLKMLSKDFEIKGSVQIEDRKKYNEQGTIVTLVIPYKKEMV